MSPGIRITFVWTSSFCLAFTQCHFLCRPPGWLPPQKTTCPRSSWFGIYEMPGLQRES